MTTYTVAYWLANQSTLDSGPSFTITDTASDISGAFDALDLDTHITQLIISDNAAVTVSTNQLFVSDTHAISLLKNANNTAYTLVVSDTGAAITTYLNNLQSNTHVTTIVVASGVVDATVAQLASDSTALANLKTSVGGSQASITVSDTSAHLHSGWANVAADGQVSSIVISDNTQLNLTATQASQTSAVEKLVFANTTTSDIVLVKDTAAHIEADLGSLETVSSFIASVTVSDSTFETLSATQVASDLAILEKVVFQSGPATFSVSDSSAHVSANLDALQDLSGSISSIAVTDNSPITVSIAQLSNDSNALALITYNSNPISVAVADTASNISGNLATLEAAIESANPPITSISVTDSNPINATITQLDNDSAVFSDLTGTYTLNVSDTASNISGALDALQAFAHNGEISAINVTDSGAIAVTVAQITNDAAAIAELVNNDTNPYTLDVTDSASDIQAAFSSLGTNSHIASVTFTDATPVLTITASQFINGATVLGEITNASFTIDVTGATASQAATIATDFTGLPNEGNATLSIAVSDTAMHIGNNLVDLGSNAYVATVAISDSNPLTLTENQFTNSGVDAGLAKMTGTYTVDVSNVTVAQVSTVEGVTGLGGTHTLSIAVSDAAANITSAALLNLGTDSSITSIAVSDSNPLTLTEAQFTTAIYDDGLAKMIGAYTVDISGVSVAQVSAVEAVTLGGTPTLSIAVSDAGGNFTGAALQTLGADNDVTSIAVTSSIVSLNVTPFTNAADDAGFAKFVGAYTVQVLGATVAQVATVEAVSLPGTPTLQIWVSDSGTNLTDSALRTLGADSKVTLILVSDSNPITLTEAQFTGGPEHAGLAKLSGSYTVDVTGATVAQVSTVEGVFLPGSATLSIAVSDAAATIAANLSTLGSDSSVTSIAVNDSNPITLTESAFTADSAGLGKMTGSYTVDVTGVTVAQVSAVEGVSLGGTPTLSIAVSDAASAVSPALATLGADSKVTSIALTGGTITITEANYTSASYDAGLAKMTGSYIVDVQGVTVAQIAAVEAVTGLGGTPTVGMDIRDTGAAVSAALVSLGSDPKVSDIILTSGVITLTEAQYTNSGDQAGLAKMLGAYTIDVTGVLVSQVSTVEGVTIGGSGTPTLSIAVSDTGSNITASKLTSLGADSKVTSIAVTSGPITLTQGQYSNTSNEHAGLLKLTGAYTVDVTNVGVAYVATVEAVTTGGTPTLSIAVADIGSRFTSAKLVTFGADSKVTSITVTSGPITLTEANFTASADHAGLAKLIGSYTVDVTGVTVAQLATVEGVSLPGTPTRSIAISDTGANLSNFEMGDLGADNHVTTIAVTSGALTFNESQFTSSGAGFAKMTGSYTVDVSGVTVAQVSNVESVSLAGSATLSIAVSDSGTNITSAALASLGSDSKVTSIAVSDSNPIVLTEAQFVPDSGGLAKLTGTYTVDVTGATVAQLSTVESFNFQGTPTLSIAVADTAAHVGTAESTLNADAHVSSITVSDTAANISTYIDQLAGLTNLTRVTVNDSGTLSLTYAQLTSDQHAFNVMHDISYPHFYYSVVGATVAQGVDVIFNRTNYISAAEGYFEQLYIVDNAANVATGSVVAVYNAAGIQINDTAADVSTSLDALEARMPNIHGLAITLSDPTDNLVVTEAQLTSDKSVLAAINNASFKVMVTNVAAGDTSLIAGDIAAANPNGVLTTMTVSDSGSNFTDAALQAIGSNSAVTSATVTGGVIQLTEAQFTGTPELAGLAKMTGSYAITVGLVTVAEVPTVEGKTLGGTPTLTINVQDVGSAITSTALSALGADPKITNISVSSGTITLTESQFVSAAEDAGLGKMNGAYTVAVTGVLASQVTAVEAVPLNGSPTLQISVSDTGGSLKAAELTTLGSDPSVTAITTSSAITLTESQFTTAGVDAGLAKMTGSYTVDVTGVLASQVAAVEAVSLPGTPTLSIAVSDAGSNITASKLTSLGADSNVTSIAVTTGPITLTQGQYSNSSNEHAGLLKMTGAYTVDVTGVGVAFVSTEEAVTVGGTPTLSLAVADTGARFTSAELVTLGADSKVTSITVTSGAISLTETQFTAPSDHAGLAKLVGAYTVDVTNVTVAKVSTVEAVTGLGGTPTLSIAVKDTAANIAGALVSLGADIKVGTIAVTSGVLSLTEAQFTASNYDLGLGKMTGSYTVDVTGVGVGQVTAVEGATLGGTPTLSIAVSDIGSNFTSPELVILGADSKVASIAVTSGVISLSEAHYLAAGDDAGLAKITGPYTVDVLGVTVAEVSAVEAYQPGSITLSIAVSDTNTNITSSALASLGADSKVTSIAVTGGPITLTEAQFVAAADDAGLHKMIGSYTVDITGVSAAQVVTVENVTGLGGTPTLSIAVSDIGSNLTSVELVSLGSNPNVSTIAVTTGAITLTEAQYTNANDDLGLAKMTGAYTVIVSGVTVAQLSAVTGVSLPGTPTVQIQISDTGAHLSGTELASLGAITDVASIAVSDGNPISTTATEFTSGGNFQTGLTELVGTYTIDVTGATVLQVSAIEGVTGLGGTPTLSIAVSDMGAHLTGAVLSSLGTDPDVTSISVSSGAISLTAGQFTSAGQEAGLAKMIGAYTVDVTTATVAQVATIEAVTLGGTPTLSIAVNDTGAHITSAALASFGADNDVTTIGVTSGPITLTEAQYTAAADDAGLAKMTGAYTVDVTGVSYGQVATVEAITGLGGTPTLSIAVSDTGGNLVDAALVALGSDPDVTSIAVTSGAISLTESQFTNSNEGAGLDKLTGAYTVDVSGVGVSQISTVEGVTLPGSPTLSIAVSDTGAAISGDFSSLGSDPDVTSIGVTSGVLSLAESAYSNSNDLTALAKMTGSYTVDVTGALVAQVSTVENAIYGGTPTLSIAVSDLGANITDAALQTLGADPDVTSISVITDNLVLTEAQFTGAAEAAGLAKMTGAYGISVGSVAVDQVATVEGQTGLGGTPTLTLQVVDYGTAFTSSVLTNLGSDPDVSEIFVISGAISLSEAHFVSSGDQAGLAKMTSIYTVDVTGVLVGQVSTVEGYVGAMGGTPTLSIAVSDVASNITDSALQTLGADNDVTSIAVTSGAIALTTAQYLGTPEGVGLDKMTGHYTVDVSGATFAQVATIEGTSVGGNPTLSITVTDSGSNITSAALVSLGADNSVATITDSSGPIVLTEAQFTNANDIAGLAKMSGSYTVDVTGVHVAQVSTVEGETGPGGTPTLVIGVVDTGANITDAALQSLGADGDVSTIQVSNGAIALTESQFTGTPEGAGLAKMTGTFDIAVSGVSVAQVSTVEGVSISGSPNLSIAVSDVGSNLTDSALQSLGIDGKVTSIADSSGVIALTEAQFTGTDEDLALAKMTGAYTVDVSGVSVAEIGAVEAVNLTGSPTLSIAVSDTGGGITSASLASMGTDNDVTSITVTGGAIALTESQFITSADEKGLEKITSAFTVDVTGVLVGQVATVTSDFSNLTNSGNGTLSIAVNDTAVHVANNAPALNTNTAVTSVVVTDSAAHVVTDLDILNGVEALTSITLTDPTPVLSLTESQFTGGLLALETIQNASFAIDVTNATASQAGTVNSDFTALSNEAQATLSIAVFDNAANVANYFGTFGRVTSVHVTDSEANIDANIDVLEGVHPLTTITITNATPVLSLTATQVLDDSEALAVVTNSAVTLDTTGATAAQAASIVSEISGFSNGSHFTLATAVSDNAVNIANALNALVSDDVSSLTINDSNPLNITYAQFQADSSVLGKLTGTDTVKVTGVTGQAYGSFTDTYINGSVGETVENNTNGSTSVIGYVNSLQFQPSGPSAHVETINVTGTHLDNFIFAGTFGNVSVTGFSLANDAIQFSSAEFANVAAVELHTTQVNGNAVVTLDSGDTITMVGISAASFEAHSNDWSFT